MLEENEKRVLELYMAIKEVEDSGRYEDFDPLEHLSQLKTTRKHE